MSTPDRQQLIDAWETMDWLKSLIKPESGTIQGDKDRLIHAIQDLAEALPPKPRPTMAEVEWDDEMHFLAEAKYEPYGLIIMLGRSSYNSDLIECLVPHFLEGRGVRIHEGSLTLTGRRYTLTEVQ